MLHFSIKKKKSAYTSGTYLSSAEIAKPTEDYIWDICPQRHAEDHILNVPRLMEGQEQIVCGLMRETCDSEHLFQQISVVYSTGLTSHMGQFDLA